MEEVEKDRLFELIKTHGLMLGEHFDAVLILATTQKTKSEGCQTYSHSSGNAYANYGQAKAWLLREEVNMKGMALNDEED